MNADGRAENERDRQHLEGRDDVHDRRVIRPGASAGMRQRMRRRRPDDVRPPGAGPARAALRQQIVAGTMVMPEMTAMPGMGGGSRERPEPERVGEAVTTPDGP
jgi:hypothetical protein